MIPFPKFQNTFFIKLNCFFSVVSVTVLLLNVSQKPQKSPTYAVNYFSRCCAFPCTNGKICSSNGSTYTCTSPDLSRTNKEIYNHENRFYKMHQWYSIADKNRHLNWIVLTIVNRIPFLCAMYNKNMYDIQEYLPNNDYLSTIAKSDTLNTYENITPASRTLPPVPAKCPTPMGIRGPTELPPVEILYDLLFKRTSFKPCAERTNILFAVYMQHFMTQFRTDTDRKLTNIKHMFDMSHIYGTTPEARAELRTFKKGKLKTRIFKQAEYPPLTQDCPKLLQEYESVALAALKFETPELIWATGNPHSSSTPLMFVLSTIWLREHNRICNLLSSEHANWTDEQIYQTAKLILTGEAIKITLTEYLPHLTGCPLKLVYDPTMISSTYLEENFDHVPTEFTVIPQWHSQIPDTIFIDNDTYDLQKLLYQNKIVLQRGLEAMINAMSTQPAGEFAYSNVGSTEEKSFKDIIEASRRLKLQSFNNYRSKFALKTFESFEELTDDLMVSVILRELYADVEAIELPVGLLIEKKTSGLVPPSMSAMANAWLVKTLFSHPINSPSLWKESTFGGTTGMNLVKTATLRKLFCLNLPNNCRNVYVNFVLPPQ